MSEETTSFTEFEDRLYVISSEFATDDGDPFQSVTEDEKDLNNTPKMADRK